MNPQDVANNGAAYLQEFFGMWSRYVELEKEGRKAEMIDLICSMIHTTESNVPSGTSDTQRLRELAIQIDCWQPSMREAFIESANR